MDRTIPTVEIREFTAADVAWHFRTSAPMAEIKGGSGFGHSLAIDPFPCYPHDWAVAETALRDAVALVRPPNDLTLWLGHFEETGRSNGLSFETQAYNRVDGAEGADGDEPVFERSYFGHIWLSGRRTPVHAAVTRFVVAHEVGHHVGYWLQRALGLEGDALIERYAAMRGMVMAACCGGKWHASPAEVFADDFRLLVAKVELEHWPHPDVARPEDSPAVGAWWAEQLVTLRAAETEAA